MKEKDSGDELVVYQPLDMSSLDVESGIVWMSDDRQQSLLKITIPDDILIPEAREAFLNGFRVGYIQGYPGFKIEPGLTVHKSESGAKAYLEGVVIGEKAGYYVEHVTRNDDHLNSVVAVFCIPEDVAHIQNRAALRAVVNGQQSRTTVCVDSDAPMSQEDMAVEQFSQKLNGPI